MVYIMHMYVNKRVEFAQRGIAHIENVCIIIYYVGLNVLAGCRADILLGTNWRYNARLSGKQTGREQVWPSGKALG